MGRKSETPAWDAAALRSPHTQADKAHRVRRMFDAIAPTYELVNRVFSMGRDARWRRRAVELARVGADDAVLDVGCGTGDFLRAFSDVASPPRQLAGCDFAHQMLVRGVASSPGSFGWCECDAQQLPFADESFTVVSCAFGVRNFGSLDRGLAEMHRVLRSGGRAVVLEFTRPPHRVVRTLYEAYARRVMPIGARLVSRDHTGAYRYLPESVVSFLGAEELSRRLEQAGFVCVNRTSLTLGVVCVCVGVKGSHE